MKKIKIVTNKEKKSKKCRKGGSNKIDKQLAFFFQLSKRLYYRQQVRFLLIVQRFFDPYLVRIRQR